MFIILVYDVNEKRVAKVLKKCREYLYWVQNSVLEGDLTALRLKSLTMELGNIIDKNEDSVIIYQFESTKYSTRRILGREKGGITEFI